MVVEQIVELDEDLMMRYLEGETVAPDELRKAAHDAIAQGKLVPVLCVCTRKDLGLSELLDLIATCGSQPGRHPPLRHSRRGDRRARGGNPARRGGHPGRPGLQDRQRSIHGQAQLSADLDAAGWPPTRRSSTSAAARRPRPAIST